MRSERKTGQLTLLWQIVSLLASGRSRPELIPAELPSSGNWRGITYGNGKFVAVKADSNQAAYSVDGVNWTAMTLPSSGNWRGVIYGNGKFVAVAYGGNQAAYSKDGINWTGTTLPSSGNWLSAACGDGKFVAVATGSNKAACSQYSA